MQSTCQDLMFQNSFAAPSERIFFVTEGAFDCVRATATI